MGDIYFPKKARKHMKEYEYMSSYWFVRGYPEYKDILSAPETPERRKAIMKLKLNSIDQALKVIPEYARGMIIDSIIQSKPLPAKDKDIQEYMIRFLVEVNDHARWQGIPGEPHRPRAYRSGT